MAALTKFELHKYPSRPIVLASMLKKGTALELDKNKGKFTAVKLEVDGKEIVLGRIQVAPLATLLAGFKAQNFKLFDSKGNSVVNGNLYKSSDFVAAGSKTYNNGDLAEGVFGAAIAARFLTKNKKISASDVEAIMVKYSKTVKQTHKFQSANKNPKVKDDVELVIGLALNNIKALADPNIRATPAMKAITDASVKYANAPIVMSWAKMVYENNTYNKIQVMADGLSDQSGTKVDVRVLISNHDGVLKPTNINVSLKAGDVGQFGQMGGSDFSVYEKLFGGMFGISIKSLESQYNKDLQKGDVPKAMAGVYKKVAGEIAKAFTNDNKKTLKAFAENIRKHATLSEKDVTLVQLTKAGAKVYTFENLEKAFAKMGRFSATVKVGSTGLPQIDIFTEGVNAAVLRIRVKKDRTRKDGSIYYKNLIEKLPGMGELIAEYAGEDDDKDK